MAISENFSQLTANLEGQPVAKSHVATEAGYGGEDGEVFSVNGLAIFADARVFEEVAVTAVFEGGVCDRIGHGGANMIDGFRTMVRVRLHRYDHCIDYHVPGDLSSAVFREIKTQQDQQLLLLRVKIQSCKLSLSL